MKHLILSVKSLPFMLTWHTKSVTILWKREFLKPNPFSPVHRALKFSAVRGTIFANSSMVMCPKGSSLAETSKYTTGLVSFDSPAARDKCPFCSSDKLRWHSSNIFLKELAISWLLNLTANCSTFTSPSENKSKKVCLVSSCNNLQGKTKHRNYRPPRKKTKTTWKTHQHNLWLSKWKHCLMYQRAPSSFLWW